MKFSAAIIFIILISAISGAAQMRICDLKIADAPAVLGLKLQMSPQEAQAVFGKDLKIKIKKDGEKTVFQNFIKKSPPPSLVDVRALYLRFFDRRLYQIEVFYESDGQTRRESTAAIIAKYGMPSLFRVNKFNQLELDCAEFTLVTDALPNPKIELTDKSILALVTEARKQAAEKKK